MQKEAIQFQDFITKSLFSKLFGITVILGIIPLLVFEKNTIVLAINSTIANSTLDAFFKVYTDTALGGTFVAISIIYLFISLRKGLFVAACGILILLVSMLFKQVLFTDFARPTGEIPLSSFTHLIPDFEYAKRFSFPSGHTMSAFGIATVLSVLIQKKSIQILLFIYATSIAFSRLYLLQHFYVDVYIGAIVGYALVTFTMYGFEKYTNPKLTIK